MSPGQEAVVSLLLSKGADINFQDIQCGWTPLHRATFSKVIPMVELILEAKPKLDIQDIWGETPLHAAVSKLSGKDVDTIVQCYSKPAVTLTLSPMRE